MGLTGCTVSMVDTAAWAVRLVAMDSTPRRAFATYFAPFFAASSAAFSAARAPARMLAMA
jgi:hypothetical protein